MKVEIKDTAPCLVPNLDHRNFTRNGEVIQAGAIVEGNKRIVDGLYKGKPFKYDLFYTDDKQIIYSKYIKPMQATEIKLGADGSGSTPPSVVNLPSVSNLGKRPLIGIAVGGLAGYYIAKKRGANKHIYTIVGAVVGFIAGKYWQSQVSVTVKPSK